MRKMISFGTVGAPEGKKFVDKILKLLGDGFELYGYPTFLLVPNAVDENGNELGTIVVCYQAIAKYEDSASCASAGV